MLYSSSDLLPVSSILISVVFTADGFNIKQKLRQQLKIPNITLYIYIYKSMFKSNPPKKAHSNPLTKILQKLQRTNMDLMLQEYIQIGWVACTFCNGGSAQDYGQNGNANEKFRQGAEDKEDPDRTTEQEGSCQENAESGDDEHKDRTKPDHSKSNIKKQQINVKRLIMQILDCIESRKQRVIQKKDWKGKQKDKEVQGRMEVFWEVIKGVMAGVKNGDEIELKKFVKFGVTVLQSFMNQISKKKIEQILSQLLQMSSINFILITTKISLNFYTSILILQALQKSEYPNFQTLLHNFCLTVFTILQNCTILAKIQQIFINMFQILKSDEIYIGNWIVGQILQLYVGKFEKNYNRGRKYLGTLYDPKIIGSIVRYFYSFWKNIDYIQVQKDQTANQQLQCNFCPQKTINPKSHFLKIQQSIYPIFACKSCKSLSPSQSLLSLSINHSYCLLPSSLVPLQSPFSPFASLYRSQQIFHCPQNKQLKLHSKKIKIYAFYLWRLKEYWNKIWIMLLILSNGQGGIREKTVRVIGALLGEIRDGERERGNEQAEASQDGRTIELQKIWKCIANRLMDTDQKVRICSINCLLTLMTMMKQLQQIQINRVIQAIRIQFVGNYKNGFSNFNNGTDRKMLLEIIGQLKEIMSQKILNSTFRVDQFVKLFVLIIEIGFSHQYIRLQNQQKKMSKRSKNKRKSKSKSKYKQEIQQKQQNKKNFQNQLIQNVFQLVLKGKVIKQAFNYFKQDQQKFKQLLHKLIIPENLSIFAFRQNTQTEPLQFQQSQNKILQLSVSFAEIQKIYTLIIKTIQLNLNLHKNSSNNFFLDLLQDIQSKILDYDYSSPTLKLFLTNNTLIHYLVFPSTSNFSFSLLQSLIKSIMNSPSPNVKNCYKLSLLLETVQKDIKCYQFLQKINRNESQSQVYDYKKAFEELEQYVVANMIPEINQIEDQQRKTKELKILCQLLMQIGVFLGDLRFGLGVYQKCWEFVEKMGNIQRQQNQEKEQDVLENFKVLGQCISLMLNLIPQIIKSSTKIKKSVTIQLHIQCLQKILSKVLKNEILAYRFLRPLLPEYITLYTSILSLHPVILCPSVLQSLLVQLTSLISQQTPPLAQPQSQQAAIANKLMSRLYQTPTQIRIKMIIQILQFMHNTVERCGLVVVLERVRDVVLWVCGHIQSRQQKVDKERDGWNAVLDTKWFFSLLLGLVKKGLVNCCQVGKFVVYGLVGHTNEEQNKEKVLIRNICKNIIKQTQQDVTQLRKLFNNFSQSLKFCLCQWQPPQSQFLFIHNPTCSALPPAPLLPSKQQQSLVSLKPTILKSLCQHLNKQILSSLCLQTSAILHIICNTILKTQYVYIWEYRSVIGMLMAVVQYGYVEIVVGKGRVDTEQKDKHETERQHCGHGLYMVMICLEHLLNGVCYNQACNQTQKFCNVNRQIVQIQNNRQLDINFDKYKGLKSLESLYDKILFGKTQSQSQSSQKSKDEYSTHDTSQNYNETNSQFNRKNPKTKPKNLKPIQQGKAKMTKKQASLQRNKTAPKESYNWIDQKNKRKMGKIQIQRGRQKVEKQQAQNRVYNQICGQDEDQEVKNYKKKLRNRAKIMY